MLIPSLNYYNYYAEHEIVCIFTPNLTLPLRGSVGRGYLHQCNGVNNFMLCLIL